MLAKVAPPIRKRTLEEGNRASALASWPVGGANKDLAQPYRSDDKIAALTTSIGKLKGDMETSRLVYPKLSDLRNSVDPRRAAKAARVRREWTSM